MPTKVKFGYMLDFRQPPQLSQLDPAAFYTAMLEQAAYVDRAGLDSIWVTEHHFTEDGYLSAVTPALAALAARTTRVTIGTYVLLAPFYHPPLAEDTAQHDDSNGRLRPALAWLSSAEPDVFPSAEKRPEAPETTDINVRGPASL